MASVKRVHWKVVPTSWGNKSMSKHHRVTPAKKRRVRQLIAAGYKQKDVAAYFGINVITLRSNYPAQLDRATMDLVALSVKTLARGMRRGETDPAKFILKTKAKDLGWTERRELTGKDGSPVIDLTKLSDKELESLENIHRKISGVAGSEDDED